MVLQIIWYLLVGVIISGYAILGGYDMGVGCLYLFNKDKKERAGMIKAIGPFWDANQVWLILAGGAIFAAFPFVFATVFSGFYLAMILVLVGLILRTVSIEFRAQLDTPGWAKIWDLAFGVGSFIPSILLGVAIGNIMRGIPLDAQTNYAGSFWGLLNPYSLLMGIFSLGLFIMQGSGFLMITRPLMIKKIQKWAKNAWVCSIALFAILSVITLMVYPHLAVNLLAMPVLFIFPLLAFLGLAFYPQSLKSKGKWRPVITSSVTLLGLVGLVGASLFPRLVPNFNTVDQFTSAFAGSASSVHLQNSLTAFNASSSPLTLTVMLIVAGIGVPVMLLYTIYVYSALSKSGSANQELDKNVKVSV
ncbi:MAG: cytochrome d ubiquinol oxidase subunit II [Syntrophomonadaceae bacterium]|jgi:cytochrome d ubiquinol oxidase subunit II|nr:cytochrome d ubiquinol oxidase subunit II [Syntrophomonadaceae bacterium]